MAATAMRRDWMKVGAAHTAEELRPAIEAAIEGLTWHEMPVETAPMSQGLMLREVLRQLDLPKVSRVAWDGVVVQPDPADRRQLATYGLLGIEANYRDGRAQLYVLDCGGVALPLCADFTANEEGG